VAHLDIFPALFATTAMGYCSILAHLFSGMSSLISTIEEPEPIIFFTCTAGLAALLSLFLKLGHMKPALVGKAEEKPSE